MVSSEPQPHPPASVVDFNNTEIAFSHKSNAELKRTSWLFKLMNKSWLVNAGSEAGLWLHKARIPIFNPLIRATIFKQFCGGISLEDSADAIDHLLRRGVASILDYGAEGKTREADFDQTLEENLKAIRFASSNKGVPVISTKVTALASNELLEKVQKRIMLSSEEAKAYHRVRERLDQICHTAWQSHVAVFIDAEETWMQETIDQLVHEMMARYNQDRVVVYHTYQMYRKDKWQSLLDDHEEARAKGYLLGAKVVRGAYMEKEREQAQLDGYPSPIQDTREDTDRDFNKAIRYCVDNFETIASCNATHNLTSNRIQAELIAEKKLPRNHAHLNFCQLYGMSDYITFNLAKAGFNVAKYVPYGPVKEVVPYLIRRARENTAVTGEMSRELRLIMAEIKRRG
jgi:proline dehydrogenase